MRDCRVCEVIVKTFGKYLNSIGAQILMFKIVLDVNTFASWLTEITETSRRFLLQPVFLIVGKIKNSNLR